MIENRILKKGFALLTAITTLSVFAVNVSAATFTTTTTYNTTDSSKVDVKSTIIGADANDQITYLAYDATKNGGVPVGGETSNIVYIDQAAADSSGKCEFLYTAEISKIGKTDVKFGAGKTSSITVDVNDPDADSIDTYTVNIVGENKTIVKNTPYVLPIIAGKRISSITLNGTPINASIIIGNKYSFPNVIGGDVLTINYEDIATSSGITKGGAPTVKPPVLNEVTPAANEITTFNKVNVSTADAAKTVEYGILFSKTVTVPTFSGNFADLTSGTMSPNVVKGTGNAVIKYKALGVGSNGIFAVRLINGTSGYLSGTVGAKYYTRPYLVIDGDYAGATYGDVTTFTAQ